MTEQTITALFNSREEAEQVVRELETLGVSRSNIIVQAGQASGGTGSSATTNEVGFWESLKDLFLPEEDRYTYSEALKRGGTLVAVQRVTEGYVDRVTEVLNRHNPVDIDEREQSWRSEGWTGYQAGSSGATTDTARTASGREEVIPVAEEQLQVGKRQVGGGRVRIRSYVVEQPVQEQVTLRDERVNVERRPVDRPVTEGDRLFQDRTIDVEEKSEEAVVSKEPRVKEELVVKKDAQERTETVQDTVRRTEVEVEDESGQVSRTGSTGTTDRDRRG